MTSTRIPTEILNLADLMRLKAERHGDTVTLYGRPGVDPTIAIRLSRADEDDLRRAARFDVAA